MFFDDKLKKESLLDIQIVDVIGYRCMWQNWIFDFEHCTGEETTPRTLQKLHLIEMKCQINHLN